MSRWSGGRLGRSGHVVRFVPAVTCFGFHGGRGLPCPGATRRFCTPRTHPQVHAHCQTHWVRVL